MKTVEFTVIYPDGQVFDLEIRDLGEGELDMTVEEGDEITTFSLAKADLFDVLDNLVEELDAWR